MKSTRSPTILLASTLALWSMPALAQAPLERLSDKDIKTLIDQVDEGRDKFEGNLDGEFKSSTVRGPGGETKVSGALQDYQDNTQKLKDRFTPDYSAGAEVITVLKQSTAINTFMLGSPSNMRGRSEWDRQAANVKRLAEDVRHHVSLCGGSHGWPDERQRDGGRRQRDRHGRGPLQERSRQRHDPDEGRKRCRQEGRRSADRPRQCRQVPHQ